MPAPTVGQPTPPPGWYPDQHSQTLRWWDGQQWTNHKAPLQGKPSSFPQTALENPSPVSGYESDHSQEQIDFHHLLSDDQSVHGASTTGQVRAPRGRPGPWLIIAGLLAVVFLVFFLVGTTVGVLNALGLNDRGCQWPRSSPRRRPVVLPAGGHGFSPVAASCFSPPAF